MAFSRLFWAVQSNMDHESQGEVRHHACKIIGGTLLIAWQVALLGKELQQLVEDDERLTMTHMEEMCHKVDRVLASVLL